MEFAQQVKAARAALDWTRETLSRHSGISIPTIKNVEEGKDVTGKTSRALIAALEGAGIFLTGRGIERSEEKLILFDSFVDVLANMKPVPSPRGW